MAFSGALTLTDLNDFITPSQACIKPVEQANGPPAKEERDAGAASTEIHIDSNGAYYEVSASSAATTTTTAPSNKLHQAQISLNDCLACSGCITSAESVLITMQSHEEVLSALAANAALPDVAQRKIPVLSVAPQSLASLATALNARASSSSSSSSSGACPRVTPRQILRRVQAFARTALGFAHVFDTTFARDVALREHIAEFMERRAAAQEGGEGAGTALPMLASACPGWICYAEKAHAEMLPFIARTKSPQQVMGTLVKAWMGPKWGRTPDGVYHVTVMPCYDKKLEASRKDFYDEVYSTRDVDCVITTGELELLMQEKGWDLTLPVPGELDVEAWSENEETRLPELLQHPGTSSGSYLHSIIGHLQARSETPLVLSVKMIRNADYEEYTLREDKTDGRVVFKGAKCYGFRNLQNIVRKVGKERGVRTTGGAAGRLGGRRNVRRGGGEGEEDKYEYVEVMACPGGCVNGGGQVKPVADTRDAEGHAREWGETGVKWGDREWTRQVEETYWAEAVTGAVALGPLGETVGRAVGKQLRTSYAAVTSEVVGLAVKW